MKPIKLQVLLTAVGSLLLNTEPACKAPRIFQLEQTGATLHRLRWQTVLQESLACFPSSPALLAVTLEAKFQPFDSRFERKHELIHAIMILIKLEEPRYRLGYKT